MKAIVNGVTIEGTPEEIFQYQQLVHKKDKESEYQKFQYDMDKIFDIKIDPPIAILQ